MMCGPSVGCSLNGMNGISGSAWLEFAGVFSFVLFVAFSSSSDSASILYGQNYSMAVIGLVEMSGEFHEFHFPHVPNILDKRLQ